jgi:plasmid stability protein
MAEVRIRKLNDDVKLLLQDQARRRGQNLEAYLRVVLEEAAVRPRRELADRLRAERQELFDKYGLFPDSAELIRQDRDARG